jgi:hypothetical protein
MSRLRLVGATALALAMASVDGVGAQVQTDPQAGQGRGRGRMGQMMAERQRMQAEMAAREKKLDALVAQMNGAKGADKVEKVAAVLTEFVEQHKAIHRQMMGTRGMMAPPAANATPAPDDPTRATEPPFPQAHDHHVELSPSALDPQEMCRPPA